MATLAANVVLRDPASGDPVVLLAGRECPDWADALIGSRELLTGDTPVEDTPVAKPRSRRTSAS